MLFVYHRDLLYCVLDCVVLIFVGCWYLFRQTKLVSIEVLMNWQDIREKQIYQKWQDWRNEYDTSMEWPSRDMLSPEWKSKYFLSLSARNPKGQIGHGDLFLREGRVNLNITYLNMILYQSFHFLFPAHLGV